MKSYSSNLRHHLSNLELGYFTLKYTFLGFVICYNFKMSPKDIWSKLLHDLHICRSVVLSLSFIKVVLANPIWRSFLISPWLNMQLAVSQGASVIIMKGPKNPGNCKIGSVVNSVWQRLERILLCFLAT